MGSSSIQDERLLLRAMLSERLAGVKRCALVGYPDHWNVGDTAIWCGTLTLLSQLDVQISYACDPWSYEPQALEKALPKGPILLHGGGNFGDIYPDETSLRDRVMSDHPHRTIIQLPQSIWFQSKAGLNRVKKILDQQSDFTLMTRDQRSFSFAQEQFDVPSLLCPDLALALEPPPPSQPPEVPVLMLWRDDIEAGYEPPSCPADWILTDWLIPGDEWHEAPRSARIFQQFIGTPTYGNYRVSRRRTWSWRLAPIFWEKLAWSRVVRGCRILQRGQCVITNRLHAHLLCQLLNIPHVICDTAQGKIMDYRRTWQCDPTRFRFAATPEEAISTVHDLLPI